MTTSTYSSDDIYVLDGLSAVREVPGMYIGGTSKEARHHLFYEVLDNSFDEAQTGNADYIEVVLNQDGSVTVNDNGRGIPVGKKKFDGRMVPAVELVLTTLHAGGKFGSKSYDFSGGLHGVGISVVNALSDFVNVEVRQNGKRYLIEFETRRELTTERGKEVEKVIPGVVKTPLKIVGTYDEDEGSGTTITFRPDTAGFFESDVWNYDAMRNRVKAIAQLLPGLTSVIVDDRNPEEPLEEVFHYENGLVDLAEEMALDKAGYEGDDGELYYEPVLAEPIALEGEITRIEGDESENLGDFRLVMQWVPESGHDISSFANGIPTPNGGEHVKALQRSIGRAFLRYGREINVIEKKGSENVPTADDIQGGMIAALSVRLRSKQFEGQTKTRLDGGEKVMRPILNSIHRALSEWIEDNSAAAKDIVDLAVRNMATRKKIEDEILSSNNEPTGLSPDNVTFVSNLHDCTVHGDISEMMIVEGVSAGSGFDVGRDVKYQAYLPIRGKIKNLVKQANKVVKDSEGNRINSITTNTEVLDIINSLGCGTENKFDRSKLRYGRVIIATDADEDGRHITALLQSIFWRLWPELMIEGVFYELRMPRYKGSWNDEVVFAFTKEERDAINAKSRHTYTWETFKGLGQMNPPEIKKYALDPEHRILRQFTLPQEASEHMDLIVEATMGTDAQIRYQLVQDFVNNQGFDIPDYLDMELPDEMDEDLDD